MKNNSENIEKASTKVFSILNYYSKSKYFYQ